MYSLRSSTLSPPSPPALCAFKVGDVVRYTIAGNGAGRARSSKALIIPTASLGVVGWTVDVGTAGPKSADHLAVRQWTRWWVEVVFFVDPSAPRMVSKDYLELVERGSDDART